MAYTVNELAKLAGVSVRTLHHYDAVGLLAPEARTEAGYRLYGKKELARLQQILFFRELGFPLEEVKRILESPGFDEAEALRRHRELLLEQMQRLKKLIGTVDRTLDAMKGENEMQDKELFENFDMAQIEEHRAKYAGEVDSKYPGWQIKDKTKRYGKKEWAAVMAEGGRIQEDLATLMDQGRDPADPEVQAVIDRHFHYIDGSFYDCTLEIYEGLSHLYVDDSRFTENIDRVRKGLAHFQSEAMQAYCKNKK